MMTRTVSLSSFVRTSRFLDKLRGRGSRVPPRIRRNASDEGPAFVVRRKINKGQMKSDFKQATVVQALQDVYEDVRNYSPGKLIFGRTPTGLYIYGSVGSGKTHLMDIFYQTVATKSKRRAHFNDFMADVHSRIHLLKKKPRRSHNLWEKSTPSDVIAPVARQLVREAWLLCFDEFQVTDIADAMILKGLFTEMFHNGMVMVATSNRSPDDLYKHGLQRTNFVPFIPVLKKHCRVIFISSKDYRTASSEGIGERYLLLGDQATKVEMESAFKKFCQIANKRAGSKTLNILGHQLTFKNTCGRVLYVSFRDLCEKNLAAADYLHIADNFDTILIKDVPKMNLNTRDNARRFIILIDTLYDKKVRVMMSAAAPPKELFDGLTERGSIWRRDQQRLLMDDLKIEGGSENAHASLFSGSEEVFAFERTVSRITEMCSNTYWNRYGK